MLHGTKGVIALIVRILGIPMLYHSPGVKCSYSHQRETQHFEDDAFWYGFQNGSENVFGFIKSFLYFFSYLRSMIHYAL